MSPTDLGAMKELVQEHGQARERVRELVALNEDYKNGNRGVVARIKEIVGWLGTFYPAHIRREDARFFPDTEKYFTREELEAMLGRFNEFDRNMIHEKYRKLFDALSGKARR